jgi:hypothetical protein
MTGFPIGLAASGLGVSVLILATAMGCGGTTDTTGGTSGGSSSGGAGGGSTISAGGGSSMPPVGACTLAFSFTTVDNQGRYSPRNVSAVWVTDAQGAFVKTLEEDGHIRQGHLTTWIQASNGSVVDAITGATNSGPRAHDVAWDCTDLTPAAVPSGTYTMNAEFATDNGGFLGKPAPALQVPFEVGSGGQVVTPPDAPYFTGVRLTIQ